MQLPGVKEMCYTIHNRDSYIPINGDRIMIALLFASALVSQSPVIDPLSTRWTFGAHEPYTMYRRVGARCTGGIDGNAQWVQEWLDWFDANAPAKMEELGLNFLHSRFYKGMGWEVEKKDFPNVKKFVRNCHAHGIKTLAYVQFGTLYPEIMRREIPDIESWAAIDYLGRKNLFGGYNGQYFRWMPCLSCREWEEYIKRMCTIALTDGGFDGIMFDNVFDYPCYCERCLRDFRAYLAKIENPEERFGIADLSGMLLPRLEMSRLHHADIKDPVLQAWALWRCGRMTDLLMRFRAHIKSVKPDAARTGPSPTACAASSSPRTGISASWPCATPIRTSSPNARRSSSCRSSRTSYTREPRPTARSSRLRRNLGS